MFNILKRQETAASFPLAGQSPPDIEAAMLIDGDPSTFIEASEATLDASAQAWRYVAGRAGAAMDNPKMLTDLESAVKVVSEPFIATNTFAIPSLAREARRLGTDFSIYALLRARYVAGQADPAAELADPASHSGLTGINNMFIRRLVRHKAFPKKELVDKPVKHMVTGMEFADRSAELVLGTLTDLYEDKPEGIVELAELYEGGAVDVDDRLKELREIVHADWYRLDEENSLLHRYCDGLFADPQPYVAEFSQRVVEATGSKRMSTVRQMAQFAVAVALQRDVALSLEDAISSTYDEWGKFEEIEALFKTFVAEKKTNLEEAFFTIAGPKSSKSIRLPRSLEDVDISKQNLHIKLGNRQVRRRNTTAKTLSRGAAHGFLPDAETITQAASQEQEKPPLDIAVAKRLGNGILHLSHITLDEVIDAFSVGNGNGSLQADVRKMVSHLQYEPIGPAAKVMQGRRVTIEETPGKHMRVPLRRFAPEDSPSLGVNGDNRYHRVVFALVNRTLALVDILSHEDYNKKR